MCTRIEIHFWIHLIRFWFILASNICSMYFSASNFYMKLEAGPFPLPLSKNNLAPALNCLIFSLCWLVMWSWLTLLCLAACGQHLYCFRLGIQSFWYLKTMPSLAQNTLGKNISVKCYAMNTVQYSNGEQLQMTTFGSLCWGKVWEKMSSPNDQEHQF